MKWRQRTGHNDAAFRGMATALSAIRIQRPQRCSLERCLVRTSFALSGLVGRMCIGKARTPTASAYFPHLIDSQNSLEPALWGTRGTTCEAYMFHTLLTYVKYVKAPTANPDQPAAACYGRRLAGVHVAASAILPSANITTLFPRTSS